MLFLDQATRKRLWSKVTRALEEYAEEVEKGRVTPRLEPGRIRELLEPFDFSRPHDPLAADDFIVNGLHEYQTHTPHPRYYGLFNPAPTTMGVAADSLVAGFNPQLAAWSHSPFAIEMERHLVAAHVQGQSAVEVENGALAFFVPELRQGAREGIQVVQQVVLIPEIVRLYPAVGTDIHGVSGQLPDRPVGGRIHDNPLAGDPVSRAPLGSGRCPATR